MTDQHVDELIQASSDSLFAPETVQDIRSRLSFIKESECDCDVSPHENALHDLVKDDVPVLLNVIEKLSAELERMRARPQCNHQWTTGTGPDDPADTGVHVCYMRWNHTDQHLCNCGATHD